MAEVTSFDLYKLAVEQFREQPRTYWIRARFFVALQSGLIAFLAFQLRGGADVTVAELAVAFLGLAISFVWLGITRASRELLVAWRAVVIELEKKGYHRASPSTSSPSIESGDAGLFQMAAQRGEGTMSRLSITRMMLILSIVFVVCWVTVSGYVVWAIATSH